MEFLLYVVAAVLLFLSFVEFFRLFVFKQKSINKCDSHANISCK